MDVTSYQNMMIIGDLDNSEICNSPIMPTVLTKNLIDSWSTNGAASHSKNKTQSHKYHLISN